VKRVFIASTHLSQKLNCGRLVFLEFSATIRVLSVLKNSLQETFWVMQRIEIENFGPIKNVEFDIKDYTVFIGPQASGKSTIVRAVYFFKSLQDELLSSFFSFREESERKFEADRIIGSIKEKLKAYWSPTFFCNQTRIVSFFDVETGEHIRIENNDKNYAPNVHIDATILQKIVVLNEEYEEQKRLRASDGGHPGMREAIFDWNFNSLVAGFFPQNNREYNFIPAGRSAFSSLRNELDPAAYPTIRDFLEWRFIRLVNRVRRSFSGYLLQPMIDALDSNKKSIPRKVKATKIKALSDKILRGEYKSLKGEDYIESSSVKKRFPISLASSGQQEAIWILLYVLDVIMARSITFSVIEEPEAHLFPESQRLIMQALTLYANWPGKEQKCPRNQLMLTTHSPYTLTPLNNLLLAHRIGQKKRESVEKIVDSDLWIDPDRFECYFVDNGTIKSVMDRNIGMIDLAELDAVSGTLNDQYDQLTALED
jgi:AAA15 family ATPase/GTPase